MGWIIFGCIIGLFAGILSLSAVVTVHYSEEFLIWIGAGPFRYGVLVTEEEQAAREAKKKQKEKKKKNCPSKEKKQQCPPKEAFTAEKKASEGQCEGNGGDRTGPDPGNCRTAAIFAETFPGYWPGCAGRSGRRGCSRSRLKLRETVRNRPWQSGSSQKSDFGSDKACGYFLQFLQRRDESADQFQAENQIGNPAVGSTAYGRTFFSLYF